MKHRFFSLAAVAALAAGMVFAQAPAAPPAGKARAGRMGVQRAVRHRMMAALNLTDAQKQQAKTIFEQSKQNAQPIVAQVKQNREALSAAVKNNDTAQIQQLSQQQGALRGQALAIRSGAMAK